MGVHEARPLFGLELDEAYELAQDLADAVDYVVSYEADDDEEAITGSAVGAIRRLMRDRLTHGDIRVHMPNKHARRPDPTNPWGRADGDSARSVGEARLGADIIFVLLGDGRVNRVAAVQAKIRAALTAKAACDELVRQVERMELGQPGSGGWAWLYRMPVGSAATRAIAGFHFVLRDGTIPAFLTNLDPGGSPSHDLSVWFGGLLTCRYGSGAHETMGDLRDWLGRKARAGSWVMSVAAPGRAHFLDSLVASLELEPAPIEELDKLGDGLDDWVRARRETRVPRVASIAEPRLLPKPDK